MCRGEVGARAKFAYQAMPRFSVLSAPGHEVWPGDEPRLSPIVAVQAHNEGKSLMSERNTVIRSLHDVGLAAWFGGSLAGAVGINGAAADVPDRNQRLRVRTRAGGGGRR